MWKIQNENNHPITADLEISQQQVVDQKINRDRRTDGKKRKRETQRKAPKMFQMCILRVEVVAWNNDVTRTEDWFVSKYHLRDYKSRLDG